MSIRGVNSDPTSDAVNEAQLTNIQQSKDRSFLSRTSSFFHRNRPTSSDTSITEREAEKRPLLIDSEGHDDHLKSDSVGDTHPDNEGIRERIKQRMQRIASEAIDAIKELIKEEGKLPPLPLFIERGTKRVVDVVVEGLAHFEYFKHLTDENYSGNGPYIEDAVSEAIDATKEFIKTKVMPVLYTVVTQLISAGGIASSAALTVCKQAVDFLMGPLIRYNEQRFMNEILRRTLVYADLSTPVSKWIPYGLVGRHDGGPYDSGLRDRLTNAIRKIEGLGLDSPVASTTLQHLHLQLGLTNIKIAHELSQNLDSILRYDSVDELKQLIAPFDFLEPIRNPTAEGLRSRALALIEMAVKEGHKHLYMFKGQGRLEQSIVDQFTECFKSVHDLSSRAKQLIQSPLRQPLEHSNSSDDSSLDSVRQNMAYVPHQIDQLYKATVLQVGSSMKPSVEIPPPPPAP